MNQINVIAELANAHQGDPDIAYNLAKKVVAAGANSIKFQIYSADELLTTTHPMYEKFKTIAFTKEQWDVLLPKAKALGVEVYADIFGLDSFDIALSHDLDGYKIHSSDVNNTKLLKKFALLDKKVFLATGGSTIIEIRYALDILTEKGICTDITMLHGFQAYPTKVEDSVLSRLDKLKELFGDKVKIGYSDHIDGDDSFATILPLMSVPYGVSYIEKHVTMDRSKKDIDYYSSYEPDEFKQFIVNVRRAETSIGKNPLSFAESERTYRNNVKKSWTTTKSIEKNEVVQEEDVVMKRTPNFFAPPLLEEIVGNKLLKNIEKEGSISREFLNNKVLAIIVARSDSSRLPGKATKQINDKSTLSHLFQRVSIAKELGIIDSIAFCTTTLEIDDTLADIAKDFHVKIYRGQIDDVLSRMILAVDEHQDHNIVLRMTGDNILIDSGYLQKTIHYHLERNAHYTDAKRLPSGTNVEVFDSYILKLIHELSKDSSGSEYLTNYITNNIDQFETASLTVEQRHDNDLRLTLDTEEDFEVITLLLEHMKNISKEFSYTMDDIFDFFEENPDILEINKPINQKVTPITVNTDINWQHYTREPIITVYLQNCDDSKLTEKTIKSVLNQKYREFELLVIGNNSSDEVLNIMEAYRNHPKVSIINQENVGVNVTHNIIMKSARGHYIMKLNAGDYIDENTLLLFSQKLRVYNRNYLVYSDFYKFNNVKLEDKCLLLNKSSIIELYAHSNELDIEDNNDILSKLIDCHDISYISLPLSYREDSQAYLQNKLKAVAKSVLDIEGTMHCAVIPIRNEDSQLALKPFSKTTLLDITINNLMQSELISKIIVSTPNKDVISHLENNFKDKVIIDLRPEKLARVNTHIENTLNYIIEKYQLKNYDTVSLINFDYPLRQAQYFDKAINTLYSFEADSVVSVSLENANFYTKKGNNLHPLNNNSDLKLEREFLLKETGGIHCISTKYFLTHNKLLSDSCNHIVIDERSAKKVTNEDDFEFVEYLYRKVQ